MNGPYVVSADIYLLLKKWASAKNFTLPPTDFFAKLRSDLRDKLAAIFARVDLLTEDKLQEGLRSLMASEWRPVVSLDRVYTEAQFTLELTRAVNARGDDLGLVNRFGTPTLERQLEPLRDLKEVVLVDDVIFSGDLFVKVIDRLAEIGVKVGGAYAGVGIGPGLDKIRDHGIQARCVYEYSEVIDEICERDFYPGVPLSGRLVAGNGNISLPYILPFGRPGAWASIPDECQKDFSEFCWRQTIALFSEIERYSQRIVRCRDLERSVKEFFGQESRYVDAIAAILPLRS